MRVCTIHPDDAGAAIPANAAHRCAWRAGPVTAGGHAPSPARISAANEQRMRSSACSPRPGHGSQPSNRLCLPVSLGAEIAFKRILPRRHGFSEYGRYLGSVEHAVAGARGTGGILLARAGGDGGLDPGETNDLACEVEPGRRAVVDHVVEPGFAVPCHHPQDDARDVGGGGPQLATSPVTASEEAEANRAMQSEALPPELQTSGGE